jgi:hypothetical protein
MTKNNLSKMKTRILLIMLFLVTLLAPACLPPDDNVNPDDAITKFLGNWNVNESCGRANYSVDIQADPGNSAQVLLYNFGNPGPGYDPAVGLVVTNSIYVSSQTIGEGWTVSGQGTYHTNGTISWNYTLIISGIQYTCSANFAR